MTLLDPGGAAFLGRGAARLADWLTPAYYEGVWLLQAAYLTTLGLLLATALLGIIALLLNVRMRRAEQDSAALRKRWEPLLLDVVAGDQAPEVLALTVQPDDRLEFLRFAMSFSLVLGGESRARLVRAAAPHLPRIAGLVQHREPVRRAFAIRLLGALGGRDQVPPLQAALGDSSPFVALAAAASLARTGAPAEAYAYDITGVLERFDAFGTAAVASMLTEHGLGLRAALIDTLADATRSDAARVAAAEALRRLGDVGAAEVAAQLLTSTPRREVGAAALRLLRAVGGPAHAPLVRSFVTTYDPVLRLHAVAALSALGTVADIPHLRRALDDESVWVAVRAAHGLRELGARDTLKHLAASPHPRARLAAQMLAS